MIKKVGLFILSFIAILGIGTSFADLISLPKHSEIPEEKCVMFESVEVGNGRVISFNKNLGKVEEEHAKYCLSDEITNDNNFVYNITSGWKSNIEFYVLDYNIDIDDVSIDNIEDKADKILINRSERPRRTIVGPYPVRHEYIYKIIVNGSGLFETKRIGENRINLEEENNI